MIMKKQKLYIEEYLWYVTVFYNTKPKDIDIIMNELNELGCPEKDKERSYKNIMSGDANNGITYTNMKMHESVISIGYADSLAQFLNSFSHELTHLCQHICQYYNINPYSEEAAYLAGNLAQQMHPLLSLFMCSCQTGK